jgi:hypothetical protein
MSPPPRQACLRTRRRPLLGISDFLALDDQGRPPTPTLDNARDRQAAQSDATTGLPTAWIPAPLLTRVNELHRTLGYPAVTDAGA